MSYKHTCKRKGVITEPLLDNKRLQHPAAANWTASISNNVVLCPKRFKVTSEGDLSEESFDWEGVWHGFVMIEQVDERREGEKMK